MNHSETLKQPSNPLKVENTYNTIFETQQLVHIIFGDNVLQMSF